MRRAIPITLRPNVLVETGRASYADVVHQLPRQGGVRECIVARPGSLLCSCDYGGLELATHAQNCLLTVGHSRLAEALNAGVKVHDALGAQILGISYADMLARVKKGDKFAKNVRQASKPANFGFPGGMGAPKLVLQQRKQGPDTVASSGRTYKGLRFCVLLGEASCGGVGNMTSEWKRKPIPPTCRRCVEVAEDIRNKWFQAWPENREYFDLVSSWIDEGMRVVRDGREIQLPPGVVAQHYSGRLRGGLDFTSAANGMFQGLAGDGAKLALWRVSRECYDATLGSPLYGCRVVLFAHDELIVEGPEETAHLWGPRISVVMVESMRVYTPDVAVEAPPALMRRWWKQAEPVYVVANENGQVVECAPSDPGAKLIAWDDRPKKAA